MKQLQFAIKELITISENEMENFLCYCKSKTFKKKEVLSKPNEIANEIFFINKGIIRVKILDNSGTEHSIHFALENQFIADYSSFIQQTKSIYTLEALEETEVIIMPKSTIDWGYANLKEGQKMGRLIAEYYFIYQDNRIKNNYFRTPKERYDNISEVFPNIHNRVPQHMIASYLGITSIHLSRLKKT
ncbi:CRP-like cAMP-binding protein [Flavobacterium dankookense]|uniref:CRP-like cAMP-binding protein n=2 Tax=Flavobacterium dankookense TaxID=706186 RepID=A0A4R6QEV8_9FLAO|nr:CRP-like cAMP-binding protein [Flavobacterium dankookense]